MRTALKVVLLVFWLGWMAVVVLGGYLSSFGEGVLVALFSAAIIFVAYWFHVGVALLALRMFRGSKTQANPKDD